MHASLPGLVLRVLNRPNRIMVVVLLCLAHFSVLAQTANTAYTADYPSVERVKAEIKGSDPTDTLARQVALFNYLYAEIDRIKYNRTVRGPYAPDEQRLMGAYRLAAYQISQDYAKSHTPAEAQAFERLHGQYEMDDAFEKDWTKRLIGPQGQAAYNGAQADLAANQQRHYNQEMQTYNDAKKQQEAAANNPSGLSNDPTAVATRRCLELGGGPLTCMGKSFTNGLMGMAFGAAGIDPESITGPGRAGVILSGRYRNPATLASLDFDPDNVAITDCGKLVADGWQYAITKAPNSLQVTINNEPRPVVLTMRPDGGLTGPGPVDVKGRVIIGYHTVTETLYVNGQPAVLGQCGGQLCQSSTRVPDYAPKIERCTIGALNAPPPVKPQSGSQSGPALSDGMGAMAMLLTGGAGGTDGPAPLPGLRMAGQFTGSGGLSLVFDAGNVILDCGPAHTRSAYTVQNTPSALVINVENSGGPFTLTVQPDSSLRGSGSTTVNGRLVSGMQGDNVTYVPRSNTCEVGSLRPKAGSTSGTSVASSAASTEPPPTTTRAGSSASLSSATPAPTAPAPPVTSSAAGRAHLLISTAFPAGANPLAGKTIMLMKDSYDNVLRKAGVSVPPGTTPGNAMKAWVISCRPPADCRAAATAMEPFIAGRALIDSTGHATIAPDVPPGQYYVSGSARSSNGPLVWDVKVDLKPGENSVVLEPRNAETVP